MKKTLILFWSMLLCGASFSQDKPAVQLNHLMLIVDSSSYEAICNSEFIQKQFAFSYHKKFGEWNGFYLIGERNYLEIFPEYDFTPPELETGVNWACLSSMKSGTLSTLNQNETVFDLEEDSESTYLSLTLSDSLCPLSVWEMKKSYYESWTKKEFKEGMHFLDTDYNSPAESDSSKNYMFNNIIGISYQANEKDSSLIRTYFEACGYTISSSGAKSLILENGFEKIRFHFSPMIKGFSVESIEFELDVPYPILKLPFGNSRLEIAGKRARWYFNVEE
ncbi:MAG: DUF5829 family protein [Flavobacteriales bacterium]|nr:DUF5829 family protein [Flavobacteriales bacterium]